MFVALHLADIPAKGTSLDFVPRYLTPSEVNSEWLWRLQCCGLDAIRGTSVEFNGARVNLGRIGADVPPVRNKLIEFLSDRLNLRLTSVTVIKTSHYLSVSYFWGWGIGPLRREIA